MGRYYPFEIAVKWIWVRVRGKSRFVSRALESVPGFGLEERVWLSLEYEKVYLAEHLL